MRTGNRRKLLIVIAAAFAAFFLFAANAYASDDNSLADLGITTQGATVSPDFQYDIWEYSVTVPAGTTQLDLSPRTTNPSATINSVSGTTLDADGNGTVVITVTSESGNSIEYVLHVTSARATEDPAQAIAANESDAATTIDTEVVQSEVETEDPRYVKVDRNSLQDAEDTIERLQSEIVLQRQHIRLLTYVLYALIAVSIIFLFILISILLRRRDMAQELKEYRANDPYRTKSKSRGNKKDKKNNDDGWGDWDDDAYEEEKPQTSWTDAQVGTPVVPTSTSVRPAAGRNRPQAPAGSAAVRAGQSQHGDATRMYKGSFSARTKDVPGDVTRDLSRVNKAEARAMKKASAAKAKEEQAAARAAKAKEEQEAARAAKAREAEAKRQAEEAKKLEKRKKEAQKAQEEAMKKARREEELKAREEAAQKASKEAAFKAREEAARKVEAEKPDARGEAKGKSNGGSNGKSNGVEINMIDL